MEARHDSTNAAGETGSSHLTPADSDELLVICGQIRRVATQPPGNRLLLNALISLEELRERVTRPANFRNTDSLGDEILEERHY